MRVAAAYPGTPSTEILETFAPMPRIYAEWSPNEKVALDVAVGAAYAGSRAMAVMKHVGLNVAADSYFYASMTGSGCRCALMRIAATAAVCASGSAARRAILFRDQLEGD